MDDVAKFKICLIGDGAVGKTSLISRFVYDKFDDKYMLTLGTKTSLKKILMPLVGQNRTIDCQLNIWDIMGQKEFERLHKTFFRGAQGAIIVTDITRKETMESVEHWVLKLFAVAGEIPLVLQERGYAEVGGQVQDTALQIIRQDRRERGPILL